MDTTEKKTIPELSIDTQTIEKLLLAAAIGDIVTYADMTTAIGRDVQHGARHYLRTAIARVLREPHRMLFEAVPNVGVKRLDDAGKIATGRSHLSRSRNQAKYAARKVKAVDDFDALPNALKVEHNVVIAQAGMLRHITSPNTTNRLMEQTTRPVRELPLRACLKAMEPLL